MALVRQRRHLDLLRLRLPDSIPTTTPAFPLQPLPLPPRNPSSGLSLSDLNTLEVLGHGNGGTVYKVQHTRTGAIYALKVLNSDSDSDPINRRRQALREIDVLRRTGDSPFIVHCHAVFHNNSSSSCSSSLAVLLEYMDSGTLDSLLKSIGPFPEPLLSLVARQVLSGLAYLHSHKIVHRDIKPSNLLVNGSWPGPSFKVKIADFGVSRIMVRTLDPCNSYVGTCAYMSPERFDPDTYGENYDGYAGDVWSLGLTLMELYLGHFPYLAPGQRPDWATLMCAICFGDPPGLPEEGGASEEFRGFLECCLQKESGKRWSAAQLLTHPFLQEEKDRNHKS